MINMHNGGPVLVLYSDTTSPTSHCVRLALAEKDIETDVKFIQPDEVSEELSELNPYGTTPTLMDRDLVLFDPQIILEYLDERFPHPPLMPVDPMNRAVNRQLRYRITRDFYGMAEELGSENEIAAASSRKTLRSSLVAIEPVFSNMSYFMSEEYTLVDCCMAPLLWRLEAYNIRLPADCRALRRYARSLFERDAFQSSMTEPEREMCERLTA